MELLLQNYYFYLNNKHCGSLFLQENLQMQSDCPPADWQDGAEDDWSRAVFSFNKPKKKLLPAVFLLYFAIFAI